MSTREVVVPRLWESSSELSAITARTQLDESLQRREADRAQVRDVVARYGVNYQVVNRFFLSGLDSLDDICWAFASEDEVAEWVSRVPALRMPTLQAERCKVMWSVLRNIARGGPGVGMGHRLARRLESMEASDAVAEGVDREAIRRIRIDFWLRWRAEVPQQDQPSDVMLTKVMEEVASRQLSVFDMEEVVTLEQQRLRASRSTRFNADGGARTSQGGDIPYWSGDPATAYLEKLKVYMLAMVIAGSSASEQDRRKAEQGEQLTGAEVSMAAAQSYFLRVSSYVESAPEGTGRRVVASNTRMFDRDLRQKIALKVGESDRRIGLVIGDVLRDDANRRSLYPQQSTAIQRSGRQAADHSVEVRLVVTGFLDVESGSGSSRNSRLEVASSPMSAGGLTPEDTPWRGCKPIRERKRKKRDRRRMNTKRKKLEKMLWAGVNKTWAVRGLRMHTRYQQCSAPAAGASRASRAKQAKQSKQSRASKARKAKRASKQSTRPRSKSRKGRKESKQGKQDSKAKQAK